MSYYGWDCPECNRHCRDRDASCPNCRRPRPPRSIRLGGYDRREKAKPPAPQPAAESETVCEVETPAGVVRLMISVQVRVITEK